ncbi:taurine catabolism dioxygenase TauD [Leptolyngbyaceae cyanobacterium CCMR0082]|uniref:Taurine catabolism dioxygenase TauD n=1 Tax=Adonisia turfae CCMR0082 TaxID=2304604 RepID=A0A6M0S965_9CYAN|nr:taurine catabolism dioxygenase TauD [Adonisia turfae CCMR0082]
MQPSSTQIHQPQTSEPVPLHDTFLRVRGKRFHYLWLRDNCLSPECHHASSFQKIYDISDHPVPPRPHAAWIDDDKLVIDWQEEPPHRSSFPLTWLLSQTYDGDNHTHTLRTPNSQLEGKKTLWNQAQLKAQGFEKLDFQACSLPTLIEQLDVLGCVCLRNVPWPALDPFVRSIGPVYELLDLGRYSTVQAAANNHDLSYEGNALPPHTDLTYIPAPPVVQLLYCVENQATGGETVLVDGFRVVQDFCADHPDLFQILATSDVQFRQFFEQAGYFTAHKTPIIKLDKAGDITQLYFSHKNFGLHLAFEKLEQFYQAYIMFSQYLKNPAYQYWFRLNPGDCLLLQNFRILHGRSAFDPSSGPRHLKVAYLEWAYFTGRRDFPVLRPFYQVESPIN